MLWNLIFDFFTRFVFGGIDSDGNYYQAFLSGFRTSGEYLLEDTSTLDIAIPFKGYSFSENVDIEFISIGGYFSMIATIISIVVIVILCCLLIKKIYNICAHIIG